MWRFYPINKPMRIPVLAANWKMHKTVEEAIAFTTAFRERVQDITDVEIVIAPPFTAIRAVAELVRGTQISVAGQNFYWETQGAFTGEVSADNVDRRGRNSRDRGTLRAAARSLARPTRL